jgi:hypothetical protein
LTHVISDLGPWRRSADEMRIVADSDDKDGVLGSVCPEATKTSPSSCAAGGAVFPFISPSSPWRRQQRRVLERFQSRIRGYALSAKEFRVRLLVGSMQMLTESVVAAFPPGNFRQPDRGLDRFHLAEEWLDALELVATRCRAALFLVGN